MSIDPFAERAVHESEVLAPADVLRSLAKPKDAGMAIETQHLKAVEDGIYRKHSELVEYMADWADLPEGADEPPEEWFDGDRAKTFRRFRVAQAAGLPKSKAPIGLTLSVAITGAIMKARAATHQAPETNNLVVVELTVAPVQYERVLVKGDDK